MHTSNMFAPLHSVLVPAAPDERVGWVKHNSFLKNAEVYVVIGKTGRHLVWVQTNNYPFQHTKNPHFFWERVSHRHISLQPQTHLKWVAKCKSVIWVGMYCVYSNYFYLNLFLWWQEITFCFNTWKRTLKILLRYLFKMNASYTALEIWLGLALFLIFWALMAVWLTVSFNQDVITGS